MVRYLDNLCAYTPYPIMTPVPAWKRMIPNDPMIAAIKLMFISWKFPRMMAAGVKTEPNPKSEGKTVDCCFLFFLKSSDVKHNGLKQLLEDREQDNVEKKANVLCQ